MPCKEYQLYKVLSKMTGELLCEGTAKQCAERLKLKPRTIQSYASDPDRSKTYLVKYAGIVTNPK